MAEKTYLDSIILRLLSNNKLILNYITLNNFNFKLLDNTNLGKFERRKNNDLYKFYGNQIYYHIKEPKQWNNWDTYEQLSILNQKMY